MLWCGLHVRIATCVLVCLALFRFVRMQPAAITAQIAASTRERLASSHAALGGDSSSLGTNAEITAEYARDPDSWADPPGAPLLPINIPALVFCVSWCNLTSSSEGRSSRAVAFGEAVVSRPASALGEHRADELAAGASRGTQTQHTNPVVLCELMS